MRLARYLSLSSALLLFSVGHSVQAADDYIKELYELNCKVCHELKSSDAPLSFDKKEWEKKIKKTGIPQLVENAITGIGNMPPMGTCMECGPEEFEDLIKYMAGIE